MSKRFSGAVMHHDDQAAGLRRLFSAPAATLAVAARDADVIDAYALIKRIVQEEGTACFRIVITHARSVEEAQAVFDKMCRVAHEYLGVRLEYIGTTVPQVKGDAPLSLLACTGLPCTIR